MDSGDLICSARIAILQMRARPCHGPCLKYGLVAVGATKASIGIGHRLKMHARKMKAAALQWHQIENPSFSFLDRSVLVACTCCNAVEIETSEK